LIRLAILSSHPIQYNAPFFAAIAKSPSVQLKVFYSWQGTSNKVDPEFGEKITWDIPLLEGYESSFVQNVAKDPGSHHFNGIYNPDMNRIIKSWGANVLLVYGWAFRTHLLAMRYFHGRIPVYFRGDSTLLTESGFIKSACRKIWLTWVYKHIDGAFYPGSNSKKYFLAYGVPEETLFHVPHCIDNVRFGDEKNLCEQTAIQQRRKMGITDTALVLTFVGKLVQRKQPVLLLRAVLELLQSKPTSEIHLIFIGIGPLLEDLKNLAGDCKYIHFLGFKNQTEMPLMYRLGDIYVLPSDIETWGLGVNEAMACSRPVIVSDKVGCAPDLVKSHISGDIFEAGNIKSLEQNIAKYIENKDLIIEMRDSANKLIRDWSIEKSSEFLEKCILRKF